MGYIEGENRKQMILMPDSIEDYISEENPVRVIDAFIDGLDMKELSFKRAKPASTGRPPYNPKDLLKLYIYGYMNGIRSSRKLEKETHRNLEVMWLINKLRPDFKTIADFRKDNKIAIKAVFKEFILLCKGWNLFGKKLIAVDGSKFKAWNSKKKNFNQRKLTKKIKEIEDKIDNYLEKLDRLDKEESSDRKISVDEIKEKVMKLKNKKKEYEGYKDIIKETGETQVSLIDPDARSMMNNQKVEVCYNIQTTVEEKNRLILDYNVTNSVTDYDQLSVMGKRAKEVLGVDTIEVLADKGYYKATDLKECLDNDITPYVAKPKNTNPKVFSMDKFQYNKENDYYICPTGMVLRYKSTHKRRDTYFRRYNNYEACKVCSIRDKCTKSKKNGRDINRWIHKELLNKIDKQTEENWDKYRKRQWLVEHPFGTVKRNLNAYYLLTKGINSVGAEMGLVFCAYNLKRVINIIGVKELIKKLKRWSLSLNYLTLKLRFFTLNQAIY